MGRIFGKNRSWIGMGKEDRGRTSKGGTAAVRAQLFHKLSSIITNRGSSIDDRGYTNLVCVVVLLHIIR